MGATESGAAALALPVRWAVHLHDTPHTVAQEQVWLAQAAQAVVVAAAPAGLAHVWTSPTGWVAPQRYRQAPRWASLADDSTQVVHTPDGRQLWLRDSGGGLVPQGTGVLNLTLLWPRPCQPDGSPMPADPTAVYLALCALFKRALARLGVSARAQAVDGSFCDGRYNLGVQGRKLVGTAQRWCQVTTPAGVQPMCMAHALVFGALDFNALCLQANALEAALGHPQRYQPHTMTDLCCVLGQSEWPPLQRRLQQALQSVLEQTV